MLPLNKTVSIIVPSYNRQALLLECIQSIFAQTYSQFEILVIDNHSSDNTLHDLHALKDTRLRIVSEARKGASFARNTGLKHAQGDILCFLDSDDLWLPQKLEIQLKTLVRSREATMLYCQYQEFFSTDTAGLNRKLSSGTLSLITLMIKKQDFLKVGYFNEALQCGEFMEWYARALQLGLQVETLQQTLALRRIHSENSTRQFSGRTYLQACKAILSKK